MADTLEPLLTELHAAGRFDSHGTFTLNSEAAMAKLSQYSLAEPSLWILNVVQAAVRAGAPRLDIRQTREETVFAFQAPSTWTSHHVELAFHLEEEPADASQATLLRGLWAIAPQDGRPFRLELPGQPEALVWSGRQMTGVPTDGPGFRLTVGLRKLSEGAGRFLMRNFQSWKRNADEATALTERAFPAPLELRLDNRRLDGFQFCPWHGFMGKSKSHPFAMGWLGSGGLRIPPGTLEHLTRVPDRQAKEESALAERLFPHLEEPAGSPEVAWLLSAHFDGDGSETTGANAKSHLSWVQAGVVVQREELHPERSVSVGLYVDAENIPTDLTGFCLREGELFWQKRTAALAAVSVETSGAPQIQLRSYIEELKKVTRMGACLVGVVGTGLTVSTLAPTGLLLTAAAAAAGMMGGQAFRSLEKKLQNAQQKLARDFVQPA